MRGDGEKHLPSMGEGRREEDGRGLQGKGHCKGRLGAGQDFGHPFGPG